MIAAAITILATAVLCLAVSFLLAHHKLKEKATDASPLRYFPAEYFNPKEEMSRYSLPLFLVGLLSFLTPLLLLFMGIDRLETSFRIYGAFGVALWLLFVITYALLILIHPSKEMPHVVLYFLAAVLLIVSIDVNALSLRAVSSVSKSEIAVKALYCSLFIISVLPLLLLVNPKLRTWYKLEAKTKKDGTVLHQRPHLFILAYSEWMLFLIAFVAFLVSMVGVFLI